MSGEKQTIAVVDDESDLREAVVEYLNMNGFDAAGFRASADFRQAFTARPCDLAILDIAMPGEDGLSLARWLRTQGRTGVIFATASGGAIDRIIGLELGGDDYLVKPYELRELLARVRSVLRRLPSRENTPQAAEPEPRGRPGAPPAGQIRFGGTLLDLASGAVIAADGSLIELTAKEFELLKILAARPGRTLSRAQILEFAPGRDEQDTERAVDIRIARLRRKIEPNPDEPRHIKTVRGLGYVFSNT